MAELYKIVKSDYEGLTIFNKDGIIYTDGVDPEREGISIADRTYYRDARDCNSGVYPVVLSKATGAPVLIISAPLTSSDGEFVGGVIGAEREKLQGQLLRAQKLEAIGILAGGVAHDFNNILGAIMGYTELTLKGMSTEDPFRGNLSKILDAAQRSAALIRQLLIFARKHSVTPVLINLNTSVKNMLKMLQRLIGENIELTWLPTEASCTVRMDPSQLDQILANLCVNARDAITDIGMITIKTNVVAFDETTCNINVDCEPGDYAQLAVIDNGCGIEKETAQHIFEPFFTTKAVGKGTGMGLSTVYGIVKENNGFINFYSEGANNSR